MVSDATNQEGDPHVDVLAIRTLLAQLSVYRFDTIKKTGCSRDVLRDFYQDLVPEELRKSLGEFYTPDWLVEHSGRLATSETSGLLFRLLDPTCGSGLFLLEAIEQKRRAALTADGLLSRPWTC